MSPESEQTRIERNLEYCHDEIELCNRRRVRDTTVQTLLALPPGIIFALKPEPISGTALLLCLAFIPLAFAMWTSSIREWQSLAKLIENHKRDCE
jgi:hypothetical protein